MHNLLKLHFSFRRFLLTFLLLLTVASSIYDFVKKETNHADLLTTFSLRRNWNSLTKTSTGSSKSIDCINGLRVLSAFWIVSGHRAGRFSRNMTDYLDLNFIENEVLELIELHQFAVDTFFVVSGYLLTISCLKAFQR